MKKVISFLLVFALMIGAFPALSFAADVSQSVSQGLILHYTFDSDSEYPYEIIDHSPYGNNAEVVNSVQKITIKNGVAHFPGYDEQCNGAALRLPSGITEGISDFTYSAWIYVDSSSYDTYSIPRFFDFGNANSVYNSFFFRYRPSDGDARFQDRGIEGAEMNSPESLITTTLFDKPFNDKWAQLTVTYEKNGDYYTPTVYINGAERRDFDNSLKTLTRSLKDLGTISEFNNGLWIGRTQWMNPLDCDFCGKMDEIRLYDRALSSKEVYELYNLSRPSDTYAPGDVKVTVKKVTDSGEPISEDIVYTKPNTSYTYNVTEPIEVYNNTIYSLDFAASSLNLTTVSDGSEVTVVYNRSANVFVKDLEYSANIDDQPYFPLTAMVTADGHTAPLPVIWDNVNVSYNDSGTYIYYGKIKDTTVPVRLYVTVYSPYGGSGMLDDVTITIYVDGKFYKSYGRSPMSYYDFSLLEEAIRQRMSNSR